MVKYEHKQLAATESTTIRGAKWIKITSTSGTATVDDTWDIASGATHEPGIPDDHRLDIKILANSGATVDIWYLIEGRSNATGQAVI